MSQGDRTICRPLVENGQALLHGRTFRCAAAAVASVCLTAGAANADLTRPAAGAPLPTPPSCALVPMPASGPVGTSIELRGSCAGILYHRLVSVYFDYTLVAQFDGISPDYATVFAVPLRARPGLHLIRMRGGLIPQDASGSFEVTGQPAPCEGDCNVDDTVTIDELIAGVNIALDHTSTSSCAALDSNGNESVEVDELVQAVRAALFGCDPAPTCHDDLECEPPAFCLAPGERSGCTCRPIESDCERDADCQTDGADDICAPLQPQDCLCAPVTVCQPGCTGDSECGTGEACNAAHHCVPAPCSADSCPRFFRCEPRGAHSECHRIPCDRNVPGGAIFCVNGVYYGQLGTCTLPVP
jgi:hypothetical protein